jgi:hypothetical protein
MRRTTAIAATLLTLSLAPALQAQYRDYRDRDQDRRYDSRNDRNDRRTAIAHEIEDVAYSIRREYERNNRRPDRDEARVLYGLRELHTRAARFEDQADYRSNRRNAGDEFARLEETFFDLSESLRYISPRPYVDRGMDRIADLMSDLSRYYGRNDRDRGRYRRQGGWHDRYGRDGRHDRDDAYRTRPPQ